MSAPSAIRRAIVLLGWLAVSAHAHPAPYSYLDLRLDSGRIEATLKAHLLDLAHELSVAPPEALLDAALAESKKEALLQLVRAGLRIEAEGRALDPELLRIEALPEQQALALHLRFPAATAAGALRIECALFRYDRQHQTFLNLYEAGALAHQELFDADHTTFHDFSRARQSAWAVVKTFLPSGVFHIFAGPDHVLFLVGLLLLGGSLPRLLAIVTAFTLAHSVTLSLAALGVVSLPARLIEPVIALSIIYVGVDNLLVGKGSRDMRAWIAFFFGLIHGFGFASVLREFGLPRQALGWSLFSFNLGVEIGQVCIVALAAVLLAGLRRRGERLNRRVVLFGSIGVMLAGSYWFIQRVFF
jgi:hydrogenase/urease accessory protein HupE